MSSQGWIAHFDESDFSSVFLSVVDELAIVPITSGNIVTLNGDGRCPSSTSTCRNHQRMVQGEKNMADVIV